MKSILNLPQRKVPDVLAFVLSTLFVPPITTLAAYMMFLVLIEDRIPQRWMFIADIFVFSILIPVGAYFYLMSVKKIKSIDAEHKEERNLPYMITTTSLALGFIALLFTDVHDGLKLLLFGYLILSLIVFGINLFWKISAHASTLSAPVGAFLFLHLQYGVFHPSFFLIMGLLLVAVGWSRVFLKFHTVMQVIAGTVLGFTVMFACLSLLMVIV